MYKFVIQVKKIMREEQIPNGNFIQWREWNNNLLMIGQRCEKLLFGYCGLYKEDPKVLESHSIIKWVFNVFWDYQEHKICTTPATFLCFKECKIEAGEAICLN